MKIITKLFLILSLSLLQSCMITKSETKGTILTKSHDNFRNLHCLHLNLGNEGQNITQEICTHGSEWGGKLPEIGSVVFIEYQTGLTFYHLKINTIKVLH